MIEKDWFEFLKCKNFTIGLELNIKKIECNYFEMDVSFHIKRMMAQIRLFVDNYVKFYIRSKIVKFCRNNPCLICNLPNSYTLEHLLTDCFNTKAIRQQVFLRSADERETWIKIINSTFW